MVFEQHMDGTIFLRKDDGTFYMESIANFQADANFSLPPIPIGWQGRTYHQGSHRHVMKPGTTEPDPDGQEWPDMDMVLANFDGIVAAKDARENPPPTLAQYKGIKKAEVRNLGRARVFQDYDEQDQRRLGLMDSADPIVISALDLINLVRTEVVRVVVLIDSKTTKTQVDTAFNSLNLPA